LGNGREGKEYVRLSGCGREEKYVICPSVGEEMGKTGNQVLLGGGWGGRAGEGTLGGKRATELEKTWGAEDSVGGQSTLQSFRQTVSRIQRKQDSNNGKGKGESGKISWKAGDGLAGGIPFEKKNRWNLAHESWQDCKRYELHPMSSKEKLHLVNCGKRDGTNPAMGQRKVCRGNFPGPQPSLTLKNYLTPTGPGGSQPDTPSTFTSMTPSLRTPPPLLYPSARAHPPPGPVQR